VDFDANDSRCQEIAEGRSIDVLEIDGASNNGVEQVRELRETSEYVASIALANVTGAVIAVLVRRMLPRTLDATGAPSAVAITLARMAGRHVGEQALRRRAQKIQDNLGTIATAVAAVAAGAGSIYTGVRALVGSPTWANPGTRGCLRYRCVNGFRATARHHPGACLH
jgi:hypothetical protein